MPNRSNIDYLWIALKGFTMGAANVIPGVSGGTIALITGIYQELINSLKAFDKNAFKLLIKRDIKKLIHHINAKFLLFLLLGVFISIFTIAKLFSFLLTEYPIQIWAFFFGLILASTFYVGKTIEKWDVGAFLSLFIGGIIALFISFTNPVPTANENYIFIFFCGIIGISGMLLPGLSGSYILMLLGNYKLLMVDSINSISHAVKMMLIGDFSFFNNINNNEGIIHFSIFLVGSIFGMLAFSQAIAWIFKHYKNNTISLLTGFIFGSLAIIWPWKHIITNPNILNRHGEEVIIGYKRFIPSQFDLTTQSALLAILFGIICIWAIEKMGEQEKK